jgi:hypothetical protein
MTETKTVAFRISEEKHGDWSDYAENSPEYDSLSHLIRRAVAREIANDGRPSAQTGSTEQVGELIDTVEKLQGRLSGVEDAVTDATDAVHASSGVDEQLPIDVFEALPIGQEDAIPVTDIARKSGRTEPSTRFALENLKRNTGTVKKVTEMEDTEGNTETVVGDTENVAGYESSDPRWFKVEGA